MKLVFDADAWLKKIPRPDRSGIVGVIFSLSALFALVVPTYPLEDWCQLLPWGCPVEVQPERPVRQHRTVIYTPPGNGAGEKGCTCVVEYRMNEVPSNRYYQISRCDAQAMIYAEREIVYLDEGLDTGWLLDSTFSGNQTYFRVTCNRHHARKSGA